MMKKTLFSGYILVAATLWGCIGLFYKQLSSAGFSQLQVVFLRVATAAVMMAVYIALRNPSWFRIRGRDCPLFIGTGVVSLAFFNYCYFSSMDELSLSVAAVLLYTAPIFVMLMSALLFKEPVTLRKLSAVAVTFLGCVLVTGAFSGGRVTILGILFGLGSGIGYALYTIFGVYALRRYRTETVTFYTFVFAAISVLPLCQPTALIRISQEETLLTCINALGIGFFGCFLPYLLYTKGLEGVPAGQASVMATWEPVVATVLSVLVFHEEMSWTKAAGIVLIVGAIVLLNAPTKSKK